MAVQQTANVPVAAEQVSKRHIGRDKRQMLWFLFFQTPWLLGLILSDDHPHRRRAHHLLQQLRRDQHSYHQVHRPGQLYAHVDRQAGNGGAHADDHLRADHRAACPHDCLRDGDAAQPGHEGPRRVSDSVLSPDPDPDCGGGLDFQALPRFQERPAQCCDQRSISGRRDCLDRAGPCPGDRGFDGALDEFRHRHGDLPGRVYRVFPPNWKRPPSWTAPRASRCSETSSCP